MENQAQAQTSNVQREMLLKTFRQLCRKHNTTELNKVQLREVFPMVDVSREGQAGAVCPPLTRLALSQDAMFDTLYRFFDKVKQP